MQNNTKSGGVYGVMVNGLFSHLQEMLFFIEDFLIKKESFVYHGCPERVDAMVQIPSLWCISSLLIWMSCHRVQLIKAWTFVLEQVWFEVNNIKQ